MKLYNSLSRKKEIFTTENDFVSIYVCGVTTYDKPHIGHAMSYIIFDTLHRYLEYKGFSVNRVQNFTDIDDKIIDRANKDSIDSVDVSEKNISAYFEVMDRLNIKRANLYPRATNEIEEIKEIILILIDKGFAYESGGSVYFSVKKYQNYGKLSGRRVEDMLEATRFDLDDNKKDFADFVLWKSSKPGEPFWESPWGIGRPGWHIECSAMVFHHLGQTIDIHGGGQDLIFPHHENEIAQSEAASGNDNFSKFWIHNGLVRMGGDKMSKSIGNVFNVEKALEIFSSDALRLWVLQSHYRKPLILDEAQILSAEKSFDRIRNAVEIKSDLNKQPVSPKIFVDKFIKSMDDDLGTPGAIASLFDIARAIFKGNDKKENVSDLIKSLRKFSKILGFNFKKLQKNTTFTEQKIEELILQRNEARNNRKFALADDLRDELLKNGVSISDSPDGTKWKRL
ncbi:MAG: cysteine--tRNA ligase [Chloroflexi bacterium]|nr:cysteine--tRNA ligase [Chloroflexota bacterium]|tara:strand:+ start:2319 stop:3677 length:1359 start_codon:yes stop_codon:yes gene_type:complete